MYYLRTKSAVNAIKFTLNNDEKVVKNRKMTMSKKKISANVGQSKRQSGRLHHVWFINDLKVGSALFYNKFRMSVPNEQMTKAQKWRKLLSLNKAGDTKIETD